MLKKYTLLLDTPKPNYKEYDYSQSLFVIEDYYTMNLFSEYNYDYFSKDVYDFKEVFQHVNTLKHKAFFKNLDLNTPTVLNQTNFLKRSSNHTDITKLSACLMRAGKKTCATKLISTAIFKVFYDLKSNLVKSGG